MSSEPGTTTTPGDPATPPDPDPTPSPTPTSQRIRQLWAATRRLGARIEANPTRTAAVVALLIAAVPLGCTAANKLFPDDAVKLQVHQLDDPCSSDWLVRGSSTGYVKGLEHGDERQFARWEREGRIAHRDFVAALVTVRGNTDNPVRIQDLTVTVTSRSAPLAGTPSPNTRGCGGDTPPEALGINLDAMAVGREVSLLRLQSSPHQKEAAKAALPFGVPVQLPRTVTDDDYYSLYLIGQTKSSSCTWQARLTWWDGEKTQYTTLDNNGRPFLVTAAP
ncbi:hypothetical protein [Streptomyces sp. NBC_01465]|uniref:hypothetical protein n=1 Tax=Streptomyces sp. NBC_01465 TaxID=2903878 RepID=UPI002E3227D7|nr:hypothetical protein [Streptomyces sp. NBC_01465]